MKNKIPQYLQFFLALGLLFGSFHFAGQAHAASPADYGREYGLLVHSRNENEGIIGPKALQVLQAYFPDARLSIKTGPADFMSQREFLILFERLRLVSEGKTTKLSDDDLYHQTWLRVRRNNLLPKARLTYRNMQEFLYRYSVSEQFGGIPYMVGLVASEDEINLERFNSLYAMRQIKDDLFAEVLKLKTLEVLSESDRRVLSTLSNYYQAFNELEGELEIASHPFSQIPDMPEEFRQVVLENDLNDILSSISYDYSQNENYRKHNLVVGTMQMHGKLYQPGEIIDFTKILAAGGWNKYVFGWVIFGGQNKWQFGGGLCGSATMAFTPSWKSGLEVVSRFPHSSYYSNLYPEESFGLDATIYRGSKNLIMKNSTNDPILYYVKDDTEKEEITLYIIGNSPYYSIEIEGPIETGRNAYKMIRRMKRFDGTVVEDELDTRYGRVY